MCSVFLFYWRVLKKQINLKEIPYISNLMALLLITHNVNSLFLNLYM